METLDKNKLNKHENKTVIEYCEDIINAQYYDLSKLKELNVIKAVYDENNVVSSARLAYDRYSLNGKNTNVFKQNLIASYINMRVSAKFTSLKY